MCFSASNLKKNNALNPCKTLQRKVQRKYRLLTSAIKYVYGFMVAKKCAEKNILEKHTQQKSKWRKHAFTKNVSWLRKSKFFHFFYVGYIFEGLFCVFLSLLFYKILRLPNLPRFIENAEKAVIADVAESVEIAHIPDGAETAFFVESAQRLSRWSIWPRLERLMTVLRLVTLVILVKLVILVRLVKLVGFV